MNQEKSLSEIVSAIILGAIILGSIFVVAAVDLIQCPECHGSIFLMWACSFCGHDGKITILQYILYGLSHVALARAYHKGL